MPVVLEELTDRAHPWSSLQTIDLAALCEGVAEEGVAELKARLDRVRLLAMASPPSTLAVIASAVERCLDLYEEASPRGVVLLCEKLRTLADAQSARGALHEAAARAVLVRIVVDRKEHGAEASELRALEAAALLTPHWSVRAHELWAFAMKEAVAMRAERDIAGAARLMRPLLEHGRAVNAYVRDRALEAARRWSYWATGGDDSKCDWPAALAVIDEALTLHRYRASAYAWASVVYLLGRAAYAHRVCGRHREALDRCREVIPLLRQCTTENGKENASWVLAEGAYIAADLLGDPASAQPFYEVIRTLTEGATSAYLRGELGYSLAMESRAALLQGRADRCATVMAEAEALIATLEGVGSQTRAAQIALDMVRGDWHESRGERAQAERCWRAVVEATRGRKGSEKDFNDAMKKLGEAPLFFEVLIELIANGLKRRLVEILSQAEVDQNCSWVRAFTRDA